MHTIEYSDTFAVQWLQRLLTVVTIFDTGDTPRMKDRTSIWYSILRIGRPYRIAMAVVWTSLFVAGSLMSIKNLPSDALMLIPHFDKVLHLVAYAGFSFLWIMSFDRRTKRKITVVITTGLMLGLLVEYMQATYTIDRQYEILDIIANTTGLFLGLLAYIGLTKQ